MYSNKNFFSFWKWEIKVKATKQNGEAQLNSIVISAAGEHCNWAVASTSDESQYNVSSLPCTKLIQVLINILMQ